MDKTIDFINVNRDQYVDELKGLLAIPSVSALPEHKDDVRRCAEWCASELGRQHDLEQPTARELDCHDRCGAPIVGDAMGLSSADRHIITSLAAAAKRNLAVKGRSWDCLKGQLFRRFTPSVVRPQQDSNGCGQLIVRA